MKDCPYYEVAQVKRPQSKEQLSTRQTTAPMFVDVPHCTHPPGKLSLARIRKVIGYAELLTCGGDQSKCQIE